MHHIVYRPRLGRVSRRNIGVDELLTGGQAIDTIFPIVVNILFRVMLCYPAPSHFA